MLVGVLLLVPADPLNPRRVDAHFASEAAAAGDLGVPVAVVDHDVLAGAGDPVQAVARVPAGAGEAVYRGWMLSSQQYAAFTGVLQARGVRLRTSPAQYQRAHELPGWYPALTDFTPTSMWTVGTARDDFNRVRAELGPGPAVVKDYVKSMKHYWHQAAFIPDVADADNAWGVATRYLELREDSLVGGLVLRRYEAFTTTETRTWWTGGDCALVGAHPDTPDQPPPPGLDVTALTPLVSRLALPFVTIDFAQRHDEGLAGDRTRRRPGQRPPDQP